VFRTGDLGREVGCAGRLNNSADNCILSTQSIATTRATAFTDHPGTGTWSYRIGVAANWLDDPTLGDLYVISPPMTITLP
jgi:hypothetical protein